MRIHDQNAEQAGNAREPVVCGLLVMESGFSIAVSYTHLDVYKRQEDQVGFRLTLQ